MSDWIQKDNLWYTAIRGTSITLEHRKVENSKNDTLGNTAQNETDVLSFYQFLNKTKLTLNKINIKKRRPLYGGLRKQASCYNYSCIHQVKQLQKSMKKNTSRFSKRNRQICNHSDRPNTNLRNWYV